MVDKIPDYVSIGCKLPNGVWLQLHEMVDGSEPQFGGGVKQVKVARKKGAPIKVSGYNATMSGPLIAPRYAITRKVPGAFWFEWLEQNKDNFIVTEKLIFAHGTDVEGVVRENESRSCGFEPMAVSANPGDPVKDHRIPVSKMKVATADEQPAQ